MKPKQYRDKGAIGALLDEYEKALYELIDLIEPISHDKLAILVDKNTDDPDCRSIQTILTHVVSSGYSYAIHIRNHLGENLDFRQKQKLENADDYIQALKNMFDYNLRVFEEYSDINLEEYDPSKKLCTRWGQYYDIEQLLEHAIVHILRHRRQIERFLLKM